MDLIPIGEAAQRLGLRTSALRYYDERGLAPARTRQGGRRMYGPDELRRLAFIQIALRLGIPLQTAAAIFDAPGPRWRDAVREHLATLDHLIELAHGAQTFLTHALECPAERPTRDCPNMLEALDLLVAGAPMDRLREQYAPQSATVTTP